LLEKITAPGNKPIQLDIAQVTTDSNGDLVSDYPAIRDEGRRICDKYESRLRSGQDVRDLTQEIGRKLKVVTGKSVGVTVCNGANKVIFVGDVKANADGTFDMVERPTIKASDTRPSGDAPWQSDVLAFRKAIVGALDAVRPNLGPRIVDTTGADDAVAQFKGKAVQWKLTFLGVNAKGEVEFQESIPSKGKGTFLGKSVEFVCLSVKADPRSLNEWRTLFGKSVVTCQATISIIGVGTRFTANNEFAGWMPMVLLEKAKPVR
jgi:hypothetical protein